MILVSNCVKIAVFEIYFEKKTYVVGTFKNICIVAKYIRDAVAGFCQQSFEKRITF